MLDRDVLEYDPAHLLVFAVDLPICSQVTRASRKDPYLGFVMDLDPTRVAELAARVYPRGMSASSFHQRFKRSPRCARCSTRKASGCTKPAA